MSTDTHLVNFPTKHKLAQDKHLSNVGVKYTKEGKLVGIHIDLIEVDNNSKKSATWTINVDNKTYVVNPTDLHDRYEGLYYFCMSSNVSKESLKDADFGVEYIHTVLEKISIPPNNKVVNLITNTNAILIISPKKEYIIPISVLNSELLTAIRDSSSWTELLNYNSIEGETKEEKKQRQSITLKFFSKYKSFKYMNIMEIYRLL